MDSYQLTLETIVNPPNMQLFAWVGDLPELDIEPIKPI